MPPAAQRQVVRRGQAARPPTSWTTRVIDRPDRVVVFADVLGFSALTEGSTLDVEALTTLDGPFASNIDDHLRAHRDPLARVFSGFHFSLRATLQLAQMHHRFTAITFSDSAFIATRHLVEATDLAVRLVQSLLSQHIPVRIGIAHGSFAALRFRSDITADGGDHAAHFLGTGVVRANAAEGCGIKGLRILLHPSAVALLNESAHNPSIAGERRVHIVDCSASETSNDVGVKHEIDYWRFNRTAEAKAWHALQDMWRDASGVAVRHYEATAEAIERMWVAQGEAPLQNLRRRTLPKRIQRVPAA